MVKVINVNTQRVICQSSGTVTGGLETDSSTYEF